MKENFFLFAYFSPFWCQKPINQIGEKRYRYGHRNGRKKNVNNNKYGSKHELKYGPWPENMAQKNGTCLFGCIFFSKLEIGNG